MSKCCVTYLLMVAWVITLFIPDQFTVKAHPALFEGEGRGMGEEGQKNEEHFSQLTQEYWANTFPS